jgi:hypothetical protein
MTMFHELGHGVHGLFSSVEYPTLSGTSVPRDYVEFPSTFHEDWAIHPEVLANYAKHHKTNESLPRELLELDLPKLIIGPNPGSSNHQADRWLPAGIVGVTHTVNMFRGDQTVLANVHCDCHPGSEMPSQWLKRFIS